jgi:hypothetical protein
MYCTSISFFLPLQGVWLFARYVPVFARYQWGFGVEMWFLEVLIQLVPLEQM